MLALMLGPMLAPPMLAPLSPKVVIPTVGTMSAVWTASQAWAVYTVSHGPKQANRAYRGPRWPIGVEGGPIV